MKNLFQMLGLTSSAIAKIKSSVSELQKLDTALTEISKTSGMTTASLKQLGDTSFETAGRYGRSAYDYLASVQQMNRGGIQGQKGNDMAEKINAVLDGTNNITNKNNVSMTDLSEAMSIAGTSAAQAGIKVNELSALTAASIAATQMEGSRVGTAWESILANLQNTASDKIRGTLDRANISMTTNENGYEKVRNPADILKDLAGTYNSLDGKDPLRSEITQNIGGENNSAFLGAFLSSYGQYEKMLNDYAAGTGSAMADAQISAGSWDNSLNKIDNTLTSIINNISSSDTIIGKLNGFNSLLNLINDITSSGKTLTSVLGTIGLTILKQNKSGGLIRLIY